MDVGGFRKAIDTGIWVGQRSKRHAVWVIALPIWNTEGAQHDTRGAV